MRTSSEVYTRKPSYGNNHQNVLLPANEKCWVMVVSLQVLQELELELVYKSTDTAKQQNGTRESHVLSPQVTLKQGVGMSRLLVT